MAPTTATRTAGTRRVARGSRNRTARTAIPSMRVTALVWSSPVTNAFTSSTKPLASVENPNSLGSWPTTMVTASPFM